MAERKPTGEQPAKGPSRLPRGRHGLPKELVAENQRKRLVAGIIAAVAERGYGDTPIAAIIEEAELSRKTFYEHFANKEECFAAAYEASYEYLREGIKGAGEADDDWPHHVRARLAALLEMLGAEPDLASLFLIAPASAGDGIVARHHEAMRELIAELTAGGPQADEGEAAGSREQALAGGVSRLVVRKLDAGEAKKLPGLLPTLTDLILRPYIGGEEAARVAEST